PATNSRDRRRRRVRSSGSRANLGPDVLPYPGHTPPGTKRDLAGRLLFPLLAVERPVPRQTRQGHGRSIEPLALKLAANFGLFCTHVQGPSALLCVAMVNRAHGTHGAGFLVCAIYGCKSIKKPAC